MGARGPVPYRAEQLARPRPPRRQPTGGTGRPAVMPQARSHWDDVVVGLYRGLSDSGQVDHFQQSDWALAVMLAEETQRYRDGKRHSAEMLRTLLDGWASLGTTEASRRRMGIELQRVIDVDAVDIAQQAIADYRRELGLDDSD